MKKIFTTVSLALLTFFSSTAWAQLRFIKNMDYTELKTPLTLNKAGQKEVIEFFAYTCPHCSNLHPEVMKWKKNQKPKDVDFYPVHAVGGSWTFPAYIKYTGEKLELGDAFDQAVFDAIFKDKKRRLRGDKETAVKFIADFGKIDTKTVEKAWDSLQVKRKLQYSAELANQAKITGTPTFIVNGKYLVPMTAAGPKRLFEVIDFLLKTTKVE